MRGPSADGLARHVRRDARAQATAPCSGPALRTLAPSRRAARAEAKLSGRMSRRLASILEKSRMSSMTCSSERADTCASSRYSRCSSSSRVCSTRSVMPSTPFIGVRISWLMLATNSVLARLAASAASASSCVRCMAASRRVVGGLQVLVGLFDARTGRFNLGQLRANRLGLRAHPPTQQRDPDEPGQRRGDQRADDRGQPARRPWRRRAQHHDVVCDHAGEG